RGHRTPRPARPCQLFDISLSVELLPSQHAPADTAATGALSPELRPPVSVAGPALVQAGDQRERSLVRYFYICDEGGQDHLHRRWTLSAPRRTRPWPSRCPTD